MASVGSVDRMGQTAGFGTSVVSARLSLKARAPVMGGDSVSLTASDPAAKKLALQAVTAWQGYRQVSGVSTITICKNGKESKQTIEALYNAPASMDLCVKAGDGKGAKIHWDGGAKAHVTKLCLNLDLSIDNRKLVNPHGWTLRDTAPGRVMRVLADPAAWIRSVGSEDGLSQVEIVSALSPAGVTREVIGIDPATSRVLDRKLYAGDTLLARFTISQFEGK